MNEAEEKIKSSSLSRMQFDYFEQMNTRWKDLDAIGHVNNANFLTYLESARINFTVKRGLSEGGADEVPFIVASINIDFLKQLEHPAILYVGQKIVRVGKTSFDILSGIFRNNEEKPVAAAITTLVCFDYKTQKTIPVPDVVRQELQELYV